MASEPSDLKKFVQARKDEILKVLYDKEMTLTEKDKIYYQGQLDVLTSVINLCEKRKRY